MGCRQCYYGGGNKHVMFFVAREFVTTKIIVQSCVRKVFFPEENPVAGLDTCQNFIKYETMVTNKLCASKMLRYCMVS